MAPAGLLPAHLLVALAPALQFAGAQSSCAVSPAGETHIRCLRPAPPRPGAVLNPRVAEQVALLAGKAALDPRGRLSTWTSSPGCGCGWAGVFCACPVCLSGYAV
jgi:hypothetical protein